MNVKINEDCTGCGLCESVNSDVFHVENGFAHVHSESIKGNEIDCKLAAKQCPASAIEIS